MVQYGVLQYGAFPDVVEEKVDCRCVGERSQRQGHLEEYRVDRTLSYVRGGEPSAASRKPRRVNQKDQETKMARFYRED